MAMTDSQVMSPNGPDPMTGVSSEAVVPLQTGALAHAHHFHMDSQLTPRQEEGAEEVVARDWIVGSEGNASWQTLEVMTTQFQSSVAGQLTTLEMQAQRCRFTTGQQSQDLERYCQGVRMASANMQNSPNVPGAVVQLVALEAEVRQQEAQASYMRMQYEQAEVEATQQGFLLKDIQKRAERYMNGMVQGARRFQWEELEAREADKRAFEVHCQRDLHQAYESQVASLQLQLRNHELVHTRSVVQEVEQQERSHCQALENQMLQVALGKQRHELETMWEHQERTQLGEVQQRLHDMHEVELSQLRHEGVAELRLAEVWKGMAQKQGRDLQEEEQHRWQEMQHSCEGLRQQLGSVGQQLQVEREERAVAQQRYNGWQTQRNLQMSELELRCAELESEPVSHLRPHLHLD